MCMDRIKKSVVTTKDIIAYKQVSRRDDHYRSFHPPGMRTREPGFPTKGTILLYEIGKKTKSKAPGIYCHLDRYSVGGTVLKVLIPAGSRAYIGEDSGSNVICAEVIKPLAEV